MSESFAPLLLETVERMLMASENGSQGVFSMGHQELLLFSRVERTSVPLKEGINQIRSTDPRPIRIPAEISNAHIPMGKLKVDYTCPGSLLTDQPVGCAIVSVAGSRPLAFKGWCQFISSVDSSQFFIIDISGPNCAFYLTLQPLGNVFPGILSALLDIRSVAQAWAKALACSPIVQCHKCRASGSPSGPFLGGGQLRILHDLSGQFTDNKCQRLFVAHCE